MGNEIILYTYLTDIPWAGMDFDYRFSWRVDFVYGIF
jgi:hypothetical protein